jgi:hypothetical protein
VMPTATKSLSNSPWRGRSSSVWTEHSIKSEWVRVFEQSGQGESP